MATREEIQAIQKVAIRGKKLTDCQAKILANDTKVAGGNASLYALEKAATGDKVAGPFGKK